MKNSIIPIFFIFILFLVDIQGQSSQFFSGEPARYDNVDGFSVNPKLGIYSTRQVGGIIGGVEFSFFRKFYSHKNPLVFSFDLYVGEEWRLTFFGDKTPPEKHSLVFLTAGRYFGEKLLRFYAKGGVGLSSGNTLSRDWKKKQEPYFTVGVPVKFGFKFLSFENFSLGIDVQAYLSYKNSLGMILLSVEFGELKPYE